MVGSAKFHKAASRTGGFETANGVALALNASKGVLIVGRAGCDRTYLWWKYTVKPVTSPIKHTTTTKAETIQERYRPAKSRRPDRVGTLGAFSSCDISELLSDNPRSFASM